MNAMRSERKIIAAIANLAIHESTARDPVKRTIIDCQIDALNWALGDDNNFGAALGAMVYSIDDVEARPMTWQPIDSAPVNVAVLVYVPDWADVRIGLRSDEGVFWAGGVRLSGSGIRPTHWMKLPDPPTEATCARCGCPKERASRGGACPPLRMHAGAVYGGRPMSRDMFDLPAIGERLRTQDNRCTAHPIFEVQEQKRVYGIDTDYDPKIAWLWADESTEVDPELATLAEAFYEENGYEPHCEQGEDDKWIVTDEDDAVSDTLRRVGYHEYWEYVQPFLTESGAQRYIEENGHNHRGKLRIYAGSAFRNWEWQAIREWLKSQPAPVEEATR